MGPWSHVSPGRAVSAGHGGGGSSWRAPAPRSGSRGSLGMEPPRSPAALAQPCPSIGSGSAGGAGSAPPAAPRREGAVGRGRQRGGSGPGPRGARGGGGLPGTSVSEDSLAELSIGSLGSEDLCKWKLEAMSWEGWGLKLSGSLSKFIPPLKESMAGAPGCLGEFAGVYSTQKGTRSFFFKEEKKINKNQKQIHLLLTVLF